MMANIDLTEKTELVPMPLLFEGADEADEKIERGHDISLEMQQKIFGMDVGHHEFSLKEE